jgi:transketolase
MALGLKLRKSPANVYTVLGDGELQEGLVWEAVMAAAHYKLSNLVAIVDYNGLQIDGKNEDVMGIAPLEDKFLSFEWNVVKCNGHDFDEIHEAFNKAEKSLDRPTVIIANTTKGKGVSFMEDKAEWHGQAPNEEQRLEAIKRIEG